MHEGHYHILFGMVTYSTIFCSNDCSFAFTEVGMYILFLVFHFCIIKVKTIFDQTCLR